MTSKFYNNETIRSFLALGIALAFLVGLTSVTQVVTQDTEVANIPAETQGASLNWAANNTSLNSYSGYPAPPACAENGNLGDANRYVCVQSDIQNVFGVFSVNEKDYLDNGAARYFRVRHSNTSTDLGLRILWSQPDLVRVDGVNRTGTQVGDEAFVKATFTDSGSFNNWSLLGNIYTAGDISIANDNLDEVHEGLLNLSTQVYSAKGTGITVAAGVPLRLEWSCQNFQRQHFDAQCGGGKYECTTQRKIDGFREVLTSSDSAAAPFSQTDRSSDGPLAYTTYQNTLLRLRCVGEQNSGSANNVFMYVGTTGALRDITWRTPARNGPWMELTINTINSIGLHSITANPPTIQAGQTSTLTWQAENAQRCQVSGPGPVDTGVLYGSNCNALTDTVTPNNLPAGVHTYTLDYYTFDTNGVEQHGQDTATVTVTGAVDVCPNISDVQPDWTGPGEVMSGTDCVCSTGYHSAGSGAGAFCEADGAGPPGPGPVDPPSVGSFSANPMRVRSGNSTELSWTINDYVAGSCTLGSNPAASYSVDDNTELSGTSGIGSVSSNPITQTTIFTLSCGGSSTQRTVTVIPTFEEI